MMQSERHCDNCRAPLAPEAQYCAQCGRAVNRNVMPTQASANIPSTVRATASFVPENRRVTGGLQASDALQKRYHIVRLVGKGGFGAVYEATDDRFQRRHVAIKEMSYSQFNSSSRAQAILDFRYEANMLAALDHPNFPKVTDFFEEDGKAYIVMDFVDGKTLQSIQEEANGNLAEERVLNWGLQLCAVLHYLHTQPEPIIFRDLKPSNIMLNRHDQIKLIDFGIARIFKPSAATDTRMVLSPNFAPLEQFGTKQTDARSDIYALGATLYVLLTNRLPVDSVQRVKQPELLVRPHIYNPQLSVATETILLTALAMEPEERFQSAYAMAQALAAARNALTVRVSERPIYSQESMQQNTYTSGAYNSTVDKTVMGVTGGGNNGGGGTPEPPSAGRRQTLRLLVAAGLTVAIGGGAIAVYETVARNRQVATPVLSTGPITFDFAYSTEKEKWISPLIDAFNSSGRVGKRSVKINRLSNGSGAIKDQIFGGLIQPTVWSPASFLELNQLRVQWKKQKNTDVIETIGDYAPVSLVLSPLVFAIWSERARALLNYYQNTINWTNLLDAFKNKYWSRIDSTESNWGVVKFGQTKPTSSNSGLLTIALLAYVAANKQEGLTTGDVVSEMTKEYIKYFDDAVFISFGQSSGPYMETVVADGPTQSDIICTYENLVLSPALQKQAKTKWQQSLQIFYPDLNILSDHPFAILQAPWVTDEQKAAALAFQRFLLADEQQKQAVALGFRPSPQNTNVLITDSALNAASFAQLATLSPNHPIDQPIQPVAQAPSGDAVNALLSTWQTLYPGQ